MERLKSSERMRKFKFFSLVAMTFLSAFIFVACSCSKEIDPQAINLIGPAQTDTFVGRTFNLSYYILPDNSTNTSVTASTSNPNVATLSTTNLTGATGTVTITTVGVGTANITFSINGTTLTTLAHKVVVHPDPQVLAVPSGLRYDNNTQSIVFNSVPNADRYELDINGTKYNVTDPNKNNLNEHTVSFKVFGANGVLETGVTYSAKVRSISDQAILFANSSYGDYEENPIVFAKLATPSNLTSENGVVTWNHIPEWEEGIVNYQVYVDGTLVSTQVENSYAVNITTAKNYTVRVKAINIDEELENLYESELSAVHTITKLANVTGLNVVNDTLQNNLHTNSYFTFNTVTGASSYIVTVSPALSDETTQFIINQGSPIKIDIDDKFVGGQTYTFTVKAVGNTPNVLESGNVSYTFTKLANVSNVVLSGETLQFTVLPITAQTKYEIVLIHNDTTTQKRVVEGGTQSLTSLISVPGNYKIYVRSLAFHDTASGINYANGQLFDPQISFYKLANPQVSRISNSAEVTWNLVEHATSYEIYYDSVYITTLLAPQGEGVTTGTFTLTDYIDTIEAGQHTVSVRAIASGINVSSRQEDMVVYSFTKLQKPVINPVVENDIIKWTAVSGAYFYAVGENTTVLTPIGTVTEYSFVNPLQSNQLRVIAGGNNVNIISSDIATFTVNRLLAPTNVRTELGVLYFNYDENNYYKIYVNGLDIGANVTNGTYTFATNLAIEQNSTISIKAFPKLGFEGAVLSSDVTVVTLNKLASPTNLQITKKPDNSETYELTWNAVANASAYRVTINAISGQNTSGMDTEFIVLGTTYNIPQTWVAGLYEVRIRAIGNTQNLHVVESVGYITSNASLAYETVKLASPTNVRVTGGKVSWLTSPNPNSALPVEYELMVESNGEVNIYRTTNTSYEISTLGGQYTISVRAIGPELQNMTSDYSISGSLNKLNTVANLRVGTNGVITWDNYNSTYGTGINVVYDLYLTTFGSSVREKVAEDYTGNSYVITQTISKLESHTFEVVVKAEGYISSNFSNPLLFQKLPDVTGFNIVNGYFVWTATPHASGYEIINTTGGLNVVHAQVASDVITYAFNPYGLYEAGVFTFKVRAIGGQNEGVNYINSDYTTNLTVTNLTSVSNLRVESGVLHWNHTYDSQDANTMPEQYEIVLYEILGENSFGPAIIYRVSNTDNQLILNNLPNGDPLPSGNYRIEVYSLGNNGNKVTSQATVLDLVTRIDANDLNVRVSSGVLMWDAFAGTNVTYELFLNDESVATTPNTSYIFNNLVPGVAYEFKLKIHALEYASSNFTNPITIVQIPEVQNFAINKNANPSQPHYFSWTSSILGGIEVAEQYEIIPTAPLAEFNGGANKGETSLYFNITTPGTYQFRIRAIGSTGNNGTLYLNGNYGPTVTVVVLDNVKNVRIENNALNFTASPMFTNNETTPDQFRIVIYSLDQSGTPTYLDEVVLTSTYVWNFKINGVLIDSGSYLVEIYSVGTQNFKVTSAPATLENATVLKTPSSLRVENGLINFGLSNAQGHVVSYEVYINGELRITITSNNEIETDKVNKILTQTATNQTLYLRAISPNAIYSAYSEEITINKLESVTGINIALNNNKSTIYWANVPNATMYRLIINPFVEEFNSMPHYNVDKKYFELSISGTEGFIIPTNLPPQAYTFELIAVGNTIASGSGNVGYLTSNNSTQSTFTIMNAPTGFRVENGILKWDQTTGAVQYMLEFYANQNFSTATVRYETMLQYDITGAQFTQEDYTVRIYALGNGTTNISSTSYKELRIFKRQSPENFKVLNGAISWTVSDNQIKQFALGTTSGTLDSNDIQIVQKIFNGQYDGVNTVLINNLKPLYTLELNISGTKIIITPSTVERNLNGFTLYYNPTLASGNYVFSARGVGNTSMEENLDGENLSLVIESLLPINYSYTRTTSDLQAYKLATPLTPVPNSGTTIVDDRLYWTVVTTPSSGDVLNYLIIAKPKGGEGQAINALVTITGGAGIASINVRDIEDTLLGNKLVPDITYTLNVIAVGTINSSLAVPPYYLNSNLSATSEVEILREPLELKVINGVVSFASNIKAQYHVMKIWNNGLSFETSLNDPTSGLISRQVLINSETLESDPYLTFEEGVYFYNFENNPLFPATSVGYYNITVMAVGDRINTISSTEDNVLIVGKWPSVELVGVNDIDIENGMFKWKHVSLVHPISNITMYPLKYKVIIVKTPSTEDGEVETFEMLYEYGTAYNGFIYFDLPDTADFEPYEMKGSVPHYFTYNLIVSAYGNDIGVADVQFVTGNTKTSKLGTRLDTPYNLTTINGVVNWIAINYAAGYDIYVSEQALNDYDTIQNGNVIFFEFGNEFSSGYYNFMVRARSNFGEYLNSRKSAEISVIKLETPKLRIENGYIKWNNTELPFAITTQTKLEITAPAGFDTNTLIDFEGQVFEVNGNTYSTHLSPTHPANLTSGMSLKGTVEGEYTFKVTYVGSNGAVSISGQNHYLATSDSIEFTFTKLPAPVIDLLSDEDEDGDTRNFVQWEEIENATDYNVVVVKFDSNDNIIKQVKFNYKNGVQNFEKVNGNIQFDLQAIINYEIANPSEIMFGDEYSIYVEAFADNSLATITQDRYSLSNNSNIENVLIPLTPTNLKLNEYGTVSWTNASLNANPVLEISYRVGLDYTEPEFVELPQGTTSYKLQTISADYVIRIKSIVGSLNNGIIAQSHYSNYIYGSFELFSAGSGSALDPYQIATAKHLFNINYYPNKHFVVTSNLDTSIYPELAQWKPLGTANVALGIVASDFTGVLDGNGYTINTLTYTNTYATQVAFINTIGASGIVKNLIINVNASNIDIANYAGVAVHNYGLIDNVRITGSVNLQQLRTDIFVGGIATYNYAGATISNTINNAVILANTNTQTNTTSVGGIVYKNSGTLYRVGNNASLTGTSVGGLAYINESEITESFNKGAITAYVSSGYLRNVIVGGLVARNEAGGTISYSYALNYENINVTNNASSTAYVGGLIGSNGSNNTISYSYAVFKPGTFAGGGITYGAIAGSSVYIIGNYINVYFQVVGGTLLAVGTVPGGNVSGIQSVSETYMKQSSFVVDLNDYFAYVAGSYPKLEWEL